MLCYCPILRSCWISIKLKLVAYNKNILSAVIIFITNNNSHLLLYLCFRILLIFLRLHKSFLLVLLWVLSYVTFLQSIKTSHQVRLFFYPLGNTWIYLSCSVTYFYFISVSNFSPDSGFIFGYFLKITSRKCD